jgi:hypothetical protein
MNNKRGLLGEGVGAFPIFLIVFVIMALFLILSAGMLGVVTRPGVVGQNIVDPALPVSYDLLFKQIDVKTNDLQKRVSIFDLLTLPKTSSDKNDLYNTEKTGVDGTLTKLSALLNEKTPCLIATRYTSQSQDSDYYYLQYNPSMKPPYTNIIQSYDNYRDAGLLSYTLVSLKGDNDKINLAYYYGACLT